MKVLHEKQNITFISINLTPLEQNKGNENQERYRNLCLESSIKLCISNFPLYEIVHRIQILSLFNIPTSNSNTARYLNRFWR